MRSIRVTVGDITLEGELNQSKTAALVWDALPLEASGQTWGDEIYFRVPVSTELESPRAAVSLGDIGYWPPGSALCIFYGKTPASSADEIVPASPVDIVGRITSDVSVLKRVSDLGRITVEKGM